MLINTYFISDQLNSTVYIMISYHSTRNDEPYCILFTRNEKYNAYIILLHGRICFKAKCERRKMSGTNFKLRLLKVTFLTYMCKYIKISIIQVINFTSTHVFQLNYIEISIKKLFVYRYILIASLGYMSYLFIQIEGIDNGNILLRMR